MNIGQTNYRKLKRVKQMRATVMKTPVEFKLAAVFFLLASFGLFLVWLATQASASEKPYWKELWVTGSYAVPEVIHLDFGVVAGTRRFEGKLFNPTNLKQLIANCKASRVEWGKEKSQRPKFAQLICEGTALNALRMPVHIEWIPVKKGGFETRVRRLEFTETLFAAH